MPRTAITLIRKHGATSFELVAGPEVGIQQQLTAFTADFCHSPHHADVAEVQLWESDGGVRRHRRLTLPPAPSPEASTPASAPEAPLAQDPPSLPADPAAAPTPETALAPSPASSSSTGKPGRRR